MLACTNFLLTRDIDGMHVERRSQAGRCTAGLPMSNKCSPRIVILLQSWVTFSPILEQNRAFLADGHVFSVEHVIEFILVHALAIARYMPKSARIPRKSHQTA